MARLSKGKVRAAGQRRIFACASHRRGRHKTRDKTPDGSVASRAFSSTRRVRLSARGSSRCSPRFLYGWRIRAAARSRTWLSSLQRQLRWGPEGRRKPPAAACPIVGSYGAKDRTQRGAADRLERALRTNSVEHDVKEYPDAGHAFLNNHDDDPAPPLLLRVMGTIMGSGAGYHEPSAKDARRRIVAFFDAHLRPPAPDIAA